LAQAVQPVTQSTLAQIKEDDLALRNTMLRSLIVSGGSGVNLANALMIVMMQPELL
jgi:hypothetical protein